VESWLLGRAAAATPAANGADVRSDLLPKGVVVEAPIGSADVYGYRSKLTPHYQLGTWAREPGGDGRPTQFAIGFNSTHTVGGGTGVVDVARCEIATSAINDALPAARAWVRDEVARKVDAGHKPRGATMLFRDTRKDGVVTVGEQSFLTSSSHPWPFRSTCPVV
jgi:tRNA/tmRNA/rRNA uracil-C5-methylase (TrmA/RlmC/RlmD family)